MKKFGWTITTLLAALAAYLCLWPVPVQPVAWTAPAAPGYAGAHAVNQKLARLSTIDLGAERGPEHVVLARDGWLYAAVDGGRILRMRPDGRGRELYASAAGRVLGFDFDSAGRLVAADAFRGLIAIDPATRQASVLADKADGTSIGYANSVVVAGDGTIYFTDASTRYAPAAWGGTFEASVLDIIEQSSTGRVLAYDPETKTTRVVARGLSFANGIALSADERTLFVAETGRYRVWAIAADAADLDVGLASPQARVLLDNLPGYPDNLMRGLGGRMWVGLVKPRSPVVDAMADQPFLREMTLRLPRALWPVPKPYGHVIAFSEDGRIVADLQDPSGAYPETTGVTETRERLYVQSLHASALGWLPAPRP